jgi:preprotein translocase subunit YajC
MLQETAAAPKGSGMSMIVMMVLLFVVMWLFMIRPQQKQQKELAKFRNALEKGQKVMTAGGIYGVVKEVKETSVVITVDKDVTLMVDKSMISRTPGDVPAK